MFIRIICLSSEILSDGWSINSNRKFVNFCHDNHRYMIFFIFVKTLTSTGTNDVKQQLRLQKGYNSSQISYKIYI